MRRGITLLEVLISMYVLLIGLLGVAGLMVAGKSELSASFKLDNATTIVRACGADLKNRGFMRPGEPGAVSNWKNATGDDVWNPDIDQALPFTINGSQVALPSVVFDPIGIGRGYGSTFPYGATGLSLYRISPSRYCDGSTSSGRQVADTIFRASDDLILVPSTTGRDNPPTQQLLGGLSRASLGNYSWLATVCPDEAAIQSDDVAFIVTVAVIYKRDTSTPGAGESECAVTFPPSSDGGEITLTNPPKAVRPGDWLMLAGRKNHPGPPPVTTTRFTWRKVIGATFIEGGIQNVSLGGDQWDTTAATTAWLVDNVVNTQSVKIWLTMP